MQKRKTTALGIFHGKKERTNKLILQSLVFGKKTTKQITLYIIDKTPKHRNRNYKSIYKNISWKPRGRLPELLSKHYIKRENLLWHLTRKGYAVALTLINDADKYIGLIKNDLRDWDLDGIFKRMTQNPLMAILIRPESAKEIKKLFLSTEFYDNIKSVTEELMKKGVDLDSMTEKEFDSYIIARSVQKMIEKTLFPQLANSIYETDNT